MKFPTLPKWLKWVLALVVLAALVMFIGNGMAKRKAEQAAIEAAAAIKKANVSIELAPSDIVMVKTVLLSQGLPISGNVRAANNAVVKAKVAGELKGLTLREGDAVTAGQIIATIDTTEFLARQNQAQKTADAAKMQIDIAQRTFDNNKALVEKGFISSTVLETSWATLEGVKATYQAAISGVDVAKKALDDTKVIAPISGVISVRGTQPGERVGIDARIMEIVDLSRLELEATLAAGDSIGIRLGQAALLNVEGTSKTIQARVVRINPAATAGSRSVLIYLALENAQGLRQGMFAQGTLATAVVKTLAVPKAAIRTDKPAPYVQVVENKKIAHKTVTLGSTGEFEGVEYIAVQGLVENTTVLQGNVGAVREGIAAKGQ